MKRAARFLAVVVAVVLAWLLLQRTMFRERPIIIEAAAATVGPVEDVVVNSEAGTVMTRSRATLGVESAGRVGEILRREGTTAKAGEVLLRLDERTERTRLLAARRDADVTRAAVDESRAAAALAHQAFDRIASLHGKGMASQEQLDEAKARMEGADAQARAADARRRSADAAVLLAEDNLSHAEIRAPFDGTVSHRFVEVGEQVIPGQALIELVSLSRLYVSAPIDERDAGRLKEGLPIRITLDTYPGVTWDSRLTRLSPVVEVAKEQNRTQEIEADFPSDRSKPTPSPGMTADVEVVLSRREAVLRIPTFAVIEGKRVLLVENGHAVSRGVEVGLRSWEWTEVRSGLRAGDRVITSLDRAGLKDGVRVVQQSSP